MNLLVEIKGQIVSITLKNSRKVVGVTSFQEERNLLEKLLPTIDALLKKHKISPMAVKRLALKTDLDQNSTSRRIAETMVNTWNWATDRSRN